MIECYVLKELGVYYNIETQKAENISCECAIKEVSQSYMIAKKVHDGFASVYHLTWKVPCPMFFFFFSS